MSNILTLSSVLSQVIWFYAWPKVKKWIAEQELIGQYTLSLKNPMDRGAWWATVQRVTKSRTQLKQLSMYAWTQTIELSANKLELCPEMIIFK